MAKKVNKNIIVSYRLTPEQHAPGKAIMERLGITCSNYYREQSLNKIPIFKESSKNSDHLIFLFNKSSNNLNQVAHRLNSAYRSGIISESLYIKTLHELILIRELMSAGVSHVD